MKHTSRILAAAMAALAMTVCSSAAVSAAEIKPCSQIKVICQNGNCGDISELLEKYCGQNCNVNEILKSVGGYCPDGNCSVDQPSQPSAKPTEPDTSPKEPDTSPEEPVALSKTDSAEFNTAYESEVLSLINAERAKYDLPPLVRDDGAAEVAHVRAKEIVKSFSHTRPNGKSCFTAAEELGVSYRSAGENIAYGYPTPQKVVDGWMNSEGHRKNILSASFSKIGIGCYESNGVLYWSQFFIG